MKLGRSGPGGPGLSAEALGPLPCLRLRAADGASALVSPFGAQLLSWQPAGGGERLFLSAAACLDGRAPIRGGVPLVFPQFADMGPLPAHGLARTAAWQVDCTGADGDEASLTLGLQDDAATRALWPQAFGCSLTVRVGGSTLGMHWHCSNRGAQAWHFQAALHTYLRVADAGQARIEGLAGATYLDRQAAGRPGVQHEALLDVSAGLDRIYTDAPARLLLHDASARLEVVSAGFPEVVVWNPGPHRARNIADLEPGGHRHMVCIEAAAVSRPVLLPPGGQWSGSQHLRVLA